MGASRITNICDTTRNLVAVMHTSSCSPTLMAIVDNNQGEAAVQSSIKYKSSLSPTNPASYLPTNYLPSPNPPKRIKLWMANIHPCFMENTGACTDPGVYRMSKY